MKLLQIQKELERLDQLLTVDVSIIRDRIEEATRVYSDAQSVNILHAILIMEDIKL